MFHQANVVQQSVPGGSLLAYWYQEVMATLSQYIAFPVTVSLHVFGVWYNMAFSSINQHFLHLTNGQRYLYTTSTHTCVYACVHPIFCV